MGGDEGGGKATIIYLLLHFNALWISLNLFQLPWIFLFPENVYSLVNSPVTWCKWEWNTRITHLVSLWRLSVHNFISLYITFLLEVLFPECSNFLTPASTSAHRYKEMPKLDLKHRPFAHFNDFLLEPLL